MTFRSISANGAVNGAVLTGTGSSGGLTVAGTGASLADGTRGTVAASLGTGGTIQNTTGDAVALNNVGGGVTLRSMVIGASAATTSEPKDAVVNVAGDGIDIVSSEYATVAAEQTAQERLAQVVADQMVSRLALYMRNTKRP